MMQYNAPPTSLSVTKREVLDFDQESESNILATNPAATPLWLALWKVILDGSINPAQNIVITDATLIASLQRDSGAGQIRANVVYSSDGITFVSSICNNLISTGAYSGQQTAIVQEFPLSTELWFGVAAFNNDSISTGKIKNIKSMIEVYLPKGATLERII